MGYYPSGYSAPGYYAPGYYAGSDTVVSVAECANALVTLAILKQELNVTDTTYDAQLVRWQCQVSKRIRDYCRNYITTEQKVVEFDGNGERTFTLPGKPVQPTASGTKLEYESGVGTFTEIPSENTWRIRKKGTTQRYELFYGSLSYGTAYGYTAGFDPGTRYRITYTTGYTTIPAPVQEVAIGMVKRLYKEAFTNQGLTWFGLAQIAKGINGTTETTILKNLEPEWEQKLAPYWTTSGLGVG